MCAGFKYRPDHARVVAGDQKNYFLQGMALDDLPGGLKAIQHGQVNVHYHDIRAELPGLC